MAKRISLTSRIAVSGAVTSEDLADAAAAGFRTILNFRPDGEDGGERDGEGQDQLSSDRARAIAERLGLAYVFIPATKHDVLTDAVVTAAQRAFRDAEGPILAHCAGGQRAAIVWAASEARNQKPIDDVLSDLDSAGFEFGFLRDDLEAQADRPRWSQQRDAANAAHSVEPEIAARKAAA